jgi:hypothetical protein
VATSGDITTVRQQTDELTETTFSNVVVGALVDELGVAGASAEIWRRKAAKFSSMVNVSEAGASHSFGDLAKNALLMAAEYQATADLELEVVSTDRVRVRKIVRD